MALPRMTTKRLTEAFIRPAQLQPTMITMRTPRWSRPISTRSLPIVAQVGFWRSLVPKFMRRSPTGSTTEATRAKKDWNPATFFIIIFLFIGSQAIQMITLRRSYDLFSYETERKLALLREVVKRVQAGEDVDVEAMLGTGNKTKEKEWDEVIRELEQEDAIFQLRKRKRNTAVPKDSTAPSPGG